MTNEIILQQTLVKRDLYFKKGHKKQRKNDLENDCKIFLFFPTPESREVLM